MAADAALSAALRAKAIGTVNIAVVYIAIGSAGCVLNRWGKMIFCYMRNSCLQWLDWNWNARQSLLLPTTSPSYFLSQA